MGLVACIVFLNSSVTQSASWLGGLWLCIVHQQWYAVIVCAIESSFIKMNPKNFSLSSTIDRITSE